MSDSVKFNYKNREFSLSFNTYTESHDLSVQSYVYDEGYQEPYGRLTTGFEKSCGMLCASYLNTNLYGFDTEEFINENNLATKIPNRDKISGYGNVYPLYLFNPKKLEELWGKQNMFDYMREFFTRDKNNKTTEAGMRFANSIKNIRDKSINNPKIAEIYNLEMQSLQMTYDYLKELKDKGAVIVAVSSLEDMELEER